MLDGIEKGGYMSHDGMCKNEYMLLCVNFCASYLLCTKEKPTLSDPMGGLQPTRLL